MALTKWEEVESRFGKPMGDVLTHLFEQFGSQSAVARELGVSQATVWTWMLKLGLVQKTILIPEKKEGAA